MMKRSIVWAVAILGFASVAMSATVGVVDIPLVGANTANYGQAITSDGRYVTGTAGTATGYIYDNSTGVSYTFNRLSDGGRAGQKGSGIGYRTYNGENQLVVHGAQAEGHDAIWAFNLSGQPVSGAWGANQHWLQAGECANISTGTYNTMALKGIGFDEGYTAKSSKTNRNVLAMGYITGASHVGWNESTAGKVTGNSVSYTGLAGVQKPNGSGINQAFTTLYSVGGSFEGTAPSSLFAMAADGSRVFGYNPTTGLSPFMATMNAFGDFQATYSMPVLAWATGQSLAYGATVDGSYAVGTNYSAATSNKAVLWDLTDLNDITVLDLTQWASDNNKLGGFTVLSKASSVGVNGDGQLVITGFGTKDGAQRAFILTIPEPATLSFLALGAVALLRRRR